MTYLEALQKLFEEAKMSVSFGEKGVKTKYQYRYPKEEPLMTKSTSIHIWLNDTYHKPQ